MKSIIVFPQCPHMRSSLVENSIPPPPLENVSALLQTVSAISGIVVTFFFLVWLSNKLVSCLTAEDLDDLPSVCPGEDSVSGKLLDMFWLAMTLSRDTKRWGSNRKCRTEVRVICVNSIPQCLDVFQMYWNTIQGTQSVCMLSFESHNFSWQVYTRWPHTIRVLLKWDHSLRSLFVLSVEA